MAVFNDRREHTDRINSLKAENPSKFWSVSTPGKGYKSLHVHGGFVAVKPSSSSVDIGGLYGEPGSKGVAKSAFATVDRTYPEHPQTLDAFDEKSKSGNINLPDLYGKQGFKETGRMSFDPQYAPPEWNEAKHGRPDVVMMGRPAAQGSLFPDQYPTTPPPKQSRTKAMTEGIQAGRPEGLQQHLPGM